jgi:long-chain acyl-CoA synthetase
MMTYRNQGFIERFLEQVAAHPEALAVECEKDPSNSLTYAGLLEKVERFKALFEKIGIENGEKVALLLPAGWEFIAALFAIVSAGGTALSLNPQLTSYELGNIIEDAGPAGVVTDARTFGPYRALFETDPSVRFVISVDEPVKDPKDTLAYEVFKAFPQTGSPLTPPSGNPVATCHYTYRGAGVPLGVPHRYQDFTACVDGMENRYPMQPGDSVLVGLPIYAIYGISIMVIFPLSVGCKLVIAHRFMDRNFVEVFEKHRVMLTCLVPLIIPKLAFELKSRGGRKNIGIEPYIIMGSSATKLPKRLQDEISDVSGFEIIQGYGLTEALAVTATYRKIEPERGTLGVPLHEAMSVRLIDGNGRDVPTGRLGEIIIGGPTVSEGFLNKPDLNARFFKNGYFHSGDLGYVDERGYLNFEGRALPIAKVAAQMVDLVELENVLCMHPDVIRAKTVEKRVPIGRNYVSATVVVGQKSDVTTKQLQAFCQGYLSFYKVPAEILIMKKDVDL